MMAVLGWVALGMAAAVLASGLRRGEEGRTGLGLRLVIGVAGALLGGLAAAAAGVGPIEAFFHTGTWLIALGGAVLALFAKELATGPRDRDEASRRAIQVWAGRTGEESDRLDRNW